MSLSGSSRQHFDMTMAKVMMAIVVVFIVLHSPKMLMALYEVDKTKIRINDAFMIK